MLRVFCAPNGGYGNELGVVREGSVLPDRDERQKFAAKLGFSETVFVDDPERGVIDIYTPSARLAFAGYPCVGVAWLLDVPELVTAASFEGRKTWYNVGYAIPAGGNCGLDKITAKGSQ